MRVVVAGNSVHMAPRFVNGQVIAFAFHMFSVALILSLQYVVSMISFNMSGGVIKRSIQDSRTDQGTGYNAYTG